MTEWVRLPGDSLRYIRLIFDPVDGSSAPNIGIYRSLLVSEADLDNPDPDRYSFLRKITPGERPVDAVNLPGNQQSKLNRGSGVPGQYYYEGPGISRRLNAIDVGVGASTYSGSISGFNNLSGRLNVSLNTIENTRVGKVDWQRDIISDWPGVSFSADYEVWNRGRPGDRSVLIISNISGAPSTLSAYVTEMGEGDGIQYVNVTQPLNPEETFSYSVIRWKGPQIRLDTPGYLNDPLGYVLFDQDIDLSLSARNLPQVIPVSPENPSPAPNPVLPMPSVPPVVIPPPPNTSGPSAPSQDQAVPPAPVVPRPIAVVDSTPGLAPNVPVVSRGTVGSPTMPLTMPRSVPNPYGGGSGSGSGDRNVARNITPRTGPQPVGG